jgi:hypothetical protein
LAEKYFGGKVFWLEIFWRENNPLNQIYFSSESGLLNKRSFLAAALVVTIILNGYRYEFCHTLLRCLSAT